MFKRILIAVLMAGIFSINGFAADTTTAVTPNQTATQKAEPAKEKKARVVKHTKTVKQRRHKKAEPKKEETKKTK